jgi:hypothetical protein
MRAAKQRDPDDEPLADEVDDLEEDSDEEARDDGPEEEFKSDADIQGLVHKLYYPDDDDEEDDL